MTLPLATIEKGKILLEYGQQGCTTENEDNGHRRYAFRYSNCIHPEETHIQRRQISRYVLFRKKADIIASTNKLITATK